MTTGLAKFRQFGKKNLSALQFINALFSVWENFEQTLAIFLMLLGKLCLNIMKPSGHTIFGIPNNSFDEKLFALFPTSI